MTALKALWRSYYRSLCTGALTLVAREAMAVASLVLALAEHYRPDVGSAALLYAVRPRWGSRRSWSP